MDTVGSLRIKILFLLGIFVAALAFSAAMPLAEAGTVMAQPDPVETMGPGESYPDSRFGRAPAKVDTGVRSGYASRAVTELESSDEGDDSTGTEPSRRPAGLMFKGGALAPTSAETPPAHAPRLALDDSRPVGAGAGSSEPNSAVARKGVQEVALIASDLGFFPKILFVSRDVPVRMFVTGSSKNTLCIMMDSFQVRKQVRSQKIEEITFTPNVPGKYRFYCPVNGMEGSLIVKELSSNIGLAAGE